VSSSATTPVPANLPLLKVDDTLAKRAFVAKSGDFVADWVQAPKFGNVNLKSGGFTTLSWDSGCRGLVQFDASGPCSFSGSSSVKVSGEVTIIAGGQAGSCKVTATPVFTAYQNLDGTLPVSTPSPTLPSSTFTVTVEVPPSERSIAIIGSRGTADVSLPSNATCRSYAEGPPPRTLPVGCVVVEGIATGYPAGTPVTPEYRFPGQTSYTAGIDVTINDDGEFTWYRKTGKKIYVRFLIGDVVSNRVIIPAK